MTNCECDNSGISNNELLDKYSKLNEQYKVLDQQYKVLNEEYKVLNEEYERLKEETSENTVIQSMNDMKEQYDRVVHNTVSLIRFKSLEGRHETLSKTCEAAILILEHNRKMISKINKYNYDDKIARKAEMETIVIRDLLQDALV
jgi:uncharacterized coiled-coil DUF342 family protein